VSWEEPAFHGHHDVGQPAHDGRSHSSGTVEGTAAHNARVERSLVSGSLAVEAASTGRKTGSCCCSCKSAISVGEVRWSGPHRTASVPDSSATLSQCLLTAPLCCLPVSPDSSATLSPGRCVTLLLPILLASASFCRVGELRESRLEAWMKSHKSEVALT